MGWARRCWLFLLSPGSPCPPASVSGCTGPPRLILAPAPLSSPCRPVFCLAGCWSWIPPPTLSQVQLLPQGVCRTRLCWWGSSYQSPDSWRVTPPSMPDLIPAQRFLLPHTSRYWFYVMTCTNLSMRRRMILPIPTGRTPGIFSRAMMRPAIRARYAAHRGNPLASHQVHKVSSSRISLDSAQNCVHQSFRIIELVPLGPPNPPSSSPLSQHHWM